MVLLTDLKALGNTAVMATCNATSTSWKYQGNSFFADPREMGKWINAQEVFINTHLRTKITGTMNFT